MDTPIPPQVFMSYSWSSPAHEAWVLKLAEDLAESGVHPIIDKWDLREGEDAAHFMERMVNDPAIKKVILICDRLYMEKANAREGGAGTEAQIITSKLYGHVKNTKFCAVLAEKDDAGQPYLPTYFSSRIYIDLSEDVERGENFDKLLRWIFDKPLHVRPELGSRPSFLSDSPSGPDLHTSTRARRAMDALKYQKPSWKAALEDYFTSLADGLESFRLSMSPGFDNRVIQSIVDFRPYRDEALEIFKSLALYDPGEEAYGIVHHFIERLLSYTTRTEDRSSWSEAEFDNFRFIAYELFMYLQAILLKSEKFKFSAYLLHQDFYVPMLSYNRTDVMHPFTILQSGIATFEVINQAAASRKNSYRADILNNRIGGTGLSMRDLEQADVILALASRTKNDEFRSWWPDTLLYDHRGDALPVFARSQSSAYFSRLQPAIGLTQEELKAVVAYIDSNGGLFRGLVLLSMRLGPFIAIDKLCSVP